MLIIELIMCSKWTTWSLKKRHFSPGKTGIFLSFFSPISLQRAKIPAKLLLWGKNLRTRWNIRGLGQYASEKRGPAWLFPVFSGSAIFHYLPLSSAFFSQFWKTRNQVTGNRPWVRIPPAPPSTRLKRRFQAGFRMLGAIRNRRGSKLRGWFLVMSSILRKSLRHKDFLGVMSVFCSPNYFTILMPLWILERKRIPWHIELSSRFHLAVHQTLPETE